MDRHLREVRTDWLRQMARINKTLAALASNKGRDDIAASATERADRMIREIGRRS